MREEAVSRPALSESVLTVPCDAQIRTSRMFGRRVYAGAAHFLFCQQRPTEIAAKENERWEQDV